MASTSSSTPPKEKKWDAFISFRGGDIRDDFLGHLSRAMNQKQINVFIDDKLDKGEEISQALLETIEASDVSVVIFSKNYADSPWCLDELVKIVECREKSGQVVLPVFYKLDPADVQELKGSFGMALNKLKSQDCLHKVDGWSLREAFHKLKRSFGMAFPKLKEECQDCLHKAEGWSNALRVISNLTGWDSRNIKPECKLIEEIVKRVLEILSQMPSNNSYNNKLVGIDLRVKKVESLLQIGSVNDNRTIGIWGMGGIGKTTIANAIFSRNMTQFDSYCFVMDVTEEMKNQKPITLRNKIICQLLGENDLHITPQLDDFIKRRLQRIKVIIVFDDVNDLEELTLECDLFNKGSRIIVTSRDRQVLKNVCPTEYIYEVEKFTNQEALQLFCLYAFQQKHPSERYMDLSKKVISYAQNNPLALRILGSNLFTKDMEVWETALKKLENITDESILKVLKVSYDVLDSNEKNIFLDIAFFLKGKHKQDIERILEGCGFYPKYEMDRLVEKSLISISANGYVNMHDLLRQTAKYIVDKECRQPEGGSRLWKPEDIYDVLTKDTGTKKEKGILLNLSEIGRIEVSSTSLKKMYKLRFLKFYGGWGEEKLHFPKGLESLPEKLRYLEWKDYPLEYLPLKSCANYLVELHMWGSQLKQLWNGDVALPNLKVMDLSSSLHLIRIPDLSGALNLEVLDLCRCESLVEIPSSIERLSKLTNLGLHGCADLCSLPSCLGLERLKLFDLIGCSKLEKCANFPRNMEILILEETAIEELPSSVEHCSQLFNLSLVECTRL